MIFDSMLPSVTLPRFAPSSSNSKATGAAPPQSAGTALFAEGAGDLDFDMLAEYLLDDGPSGGSGDALGLAAFDFR